MLSRFKVGLAQLAVLAFLCVLAAVVVAMAWYQRLGSDVAAVRAGREQLQSLVEKEQRYFLSKGVFAPTLDALGPQVPEDGQWSYRLVASRLKDAPVVMIEAVTDNRALFVGSDGQVYLSTLKPLPMKETSRTPD